MKRKNEIILGTCRLFDKPLVSSVVAKFEEEMNDQDSYTIDVGEYYQTDHQVIHNIKDPSKVTVNYKLWILNEEGTQDIASRVTTAKALYKDFANIQFMIHTPTPSLSLDLAEVKKGFDEVGEEIIGVSNFNMTQLETFKSVFGKYPKYNQMEVNVNTLNHASTLSTLGFMKDKNIAVQAFGVIRRGQYLNYDNSSFLTAPMTKWGIEGQFVKLEYAFLAVRDWLTSLDIDYSIVVSPNNADGCIRWYADMMDNEVILSHEDVNDIVDRFESGKDSPDYTNLSEHNSAIENPKKGHIYLAGPLFDRGQIANRYADEKFIKENFPSLTMYNPINLNVEEWAGTKAQETSCLTFYNKDMEEIKKADIMIADLDGMDPGTIAEIGIFSERIRQEKDNNLRLIVIASNWEFWNKSPIGEANPTLGINDFLEGVVRDTGVFVKTLDGVKNYLEDYVYDIEVDNVGEMR